MTYTKLTAAQSEDLLKRATARAAAKKAGNTTEYNPLAGIDHKHITASWNKQSRPSLATKIFAGTVAASVLWLFLTLVSTVGFFGAILICLGGSFFLGCLKLFLSAVLSLMAF